MNRLEIEAIGIDFVCRKLVSRRHIIITKHFRVGRYEIDIVSEFQGQRIFHEVRTTHSNDIAQVFPMHKVLCICNAAENAGTNCIAEFHYVQLDAGGRIADHQQMTASELL